MQNAEALEVVVDPVDVCSEFGSVAEYERARAWQLDRDLVDHLAWARAHDQYSVRESDGLLDAVSDE
jgi:hypothetical protein